MRSYDFDDDIEAIFMQVSNSLLRSDIEWLMRSVGNIDLDTVH